MYFSPLFLHIVQTSINHLYPDFTYLGMGGLAPLIGASVCIFPSVRVNYRCIDMPARKSGVVRQVTCDPEGNQWVGVIY